MCKSGGGSPPVPSAASTTFNSTVTPNPPAGALYNDFLNRANALSSTPFNPAMLGQVAPLNVLQQQAGSQLFNLGMEASGFGNTLGTFDPAQVRAIESPYTEDVVSATQDWFNNQNAIQGNDLLSQAIRSGNAFGGDRAGVAEGVLAGQQQLAQAPVIAGLRQAGYTQALNEYNTLKQLGLAGRQFGIQGAGAALGAGGLFQAQQQREFDVAQQNAMMSSAYPFQTLNWYGSILGGIGPLLGTTAAGSNNPPEASGTASTIGTIGAGIGLGTAALGAAGTGTGQKDGGSIGYARGGIVGYDDGGDVFGSEPAGGPSDIAYRTDDDDRPSRRDEAPPPTTPSPRLPPTTATSAGSAWGRNVGQLKTSARQLPQPILPQTGGGTTQQPKSETQQWLELGTKAIPLVTGLMALSDPKTKTDVQRVGKTDDGEPLYGFRYKGDPKSYPKVVGPMATPDDVPLPRPDPRNPRMERGLYGEPPRKGLPPEGREHLNSIFGRAEGGRVPYRNPYENVPRAPGDYRRTPGMADSEYRPYDFTDEEMRGIERSASRNTIDVPHHLIPFGTYMRHWDAFRNRQLNDDPEGLYEMSPKALRQRGYAWGGYIPHLANGGSDEPLTMTDLGVLSEEGNELPANIAGPARGSPTGLPVDAGNVSNLERVRERFRPRLENDPALARKFDINTTAEVGTRPLARDFYQGLTLDRAASRGEDLAYTLSPKAGYYPPETTNATRASGMGVSPVLWGGANPANFATGNASYDPKTGRWVGFARGPQTGSVQTGSGTETGGIEGPDLPFMRRVGYTGPSRTAIGPAGPQGTAAAGPGSAREVDEAERPSTGPATRSSGERTGSTQPSLRSDRTVDALTKPAPTFAQRLATNPFWQFGTALMAKPGIKGREGQAIGSALQSMSAQQLTERNRVLDEKPQMITRPDGSVHFLNSEGRLTQVFGPDATKTAAEKRAQEKWDIEKATPNTLKVQKRGPFGSTTTEEVPFTISPDGTVKPFTIPGQEQPPAAAPPQPAPAPAPPAAPSVQQPQAPVRQTQAEPQDWQEIGANSGTYYSASTQQYKRPDGSIIPALDKGVRPGLPPATSPIGSGPESTSAAGPAEGPSLNGTARAWSSGEVQPAGTITDQQALASRRNEAALQGLTPEEQQTIKNIVDGKADPNKLFVGKQAALREPALRKAIEYDPSFTPALAAQRAKAATAFGVNGVEARNIQSHDTAIQHLGRAMTNIERLNNYDYQWINQARDWAQKKIPGMRDPQLQQALGALDFDYHAVASELMRAFRGTGSASEREAHRIAEKLNVYSPLDVQRETIREATELLYGRVEASAKTYNTAVGPGYERSPESWLSNKSRETLGRAISIDPNKPIPAAPRPDGAQPQQQGPTGQGGLSAEDQKAIDWARSNPGNPKAKEILQLHGLQ